ncbi:phage tail tube assembly chaperone [Paucilactobacillus sp. N302-9]
MSVKILIEKLSKKPFFVNASNKNMKRVYQFQLDSAHAEDIEGLEPVDQIQKSLDFTNQLTGFLEDVLQLSDAQIKKIDDFETDETIALASRVSMRLMGMTDAEVKEALKPEVQDDEKKESVSVKESSN